MYIDYFYFSTYYTYYTTYLFFIVLNEHECIKCVKCVKVIYKCQMTHINYLFVIIMLRYDASINTFRLMYIIPPLANIKTMFLNMSFR